MSLRTREAVIVCAAVLCVCGRPAPAAAQGNGHGNAFGHYKGPSASRSTAPDGSSDSSASVEVDVRNFGSWLDDASVMPKGTGFVSIGFGLWNMPGYREFDLPVLDSGFAVNRRVQVGMSVPYYHASQPGAPVARGFGDAYFSSKIQIRDAASHPIGFAVIPMLQMLSTAPAFGTSRVSWALPASVEVQRRGVRIYGSAGYFSRGSVFASRALETAVSKRAWVTGSLSRSYSTHASAPGTVSTFPRTRTDITGSASINVSDDVAFFGSVGRTYADTNPVMVAGGITLKFSR